MKLRPYQQEIVDSTEAGWKEYDRQLAVCPTGGGKTVVFAHLAARQPGRTLILAHREELIDQAIAKIEAATGIIAEKEKAEHSASLTAGVVVASIQSMIRRLDKWPSDHFNLVVCDEAHHAISPSWQTVLNHFSARVLGVTATPDRGDKKDLGAYFENIPAEVGLFDLVNAGYLSRISLKSIPLEIDLNTVRQTAGDFNESDLGKALDPYLGKIAESIALHAPFRRTLAFLPLIATSRKFVEACKDAGLAAGHVDGESPDRKEILQRFNRFEFDVLSNAMLLTEGFDDPGIDCVVILRPTKSRPLYAQMVGRGTRIDPAKKDLLLLDFLWLHEKHRIVRPASLIANCDEHADIISELSQKKDALPSDIAAQMPLDLEGLASIAQAQREEALRQKLREQSNRDAKVVSADEFAVEANRFDIADFEPAMPWEKESVTESQAKYLKRAGIDISTVRGKGHASRLLSLHFGRVNNRMASAKARMKMKQMGHPNADNATEGEARKFFAQLRKKVAA